MNETKDRILRMVREGIISKEEGDELLAALKSDAEEKPQAPKEEKTEPTPAPPPRAAPTVQGKTPPSRSAGVTIAAFVLILMSLAWLTGGPPSILHRNDWIIQVQPFRMTTGCFLGSPFLFTTFYTIFGLLILIPAIGVLFFKEWARKLLVIVLAVHAVLSIFLLMQASVFFRGFGISRSSLMGLSGASAFFLWLIADIFFIWYFSRTCIRPQFS